MEGLDAKPGGAAAVAVYEHVAAERALEGFLDWQERRASWSAGWREHSGLGRSTIYLTEDELAGLVSAMEQVLLTYIEERAAGRPGVPARGLGTGGLQPVRGAARADLERTVSAIRRALGQPGLRLLLAAGLVSVTGDWVLPVGLTYQVYRLTGSTLASGAMLLAWWVPQIVLSSPPGYSPTGGTVSSRWSSPTCCSPRACCSCSHTARARWGSSTWSSPGKQRSSSSSRPSSR